MGVPDSDVATTMFSTSSIDRRYPRPRTWYSIEFPSTTFPPTSRFDIATAWVTALTGTR